MTKEAVEEWIKEGEGKEWFENQKKPLLDKRDELLGEIAGLKKRLADAASGSNAKGEKLQALINRFKNEYVNRVFDDRDKFKNVLIGNSDLREFVRTKIEKLAEVDGGLVSDINDTGNFTFQTSGGKTFEDYYSEWLSTESAKSFIANPSTGGGARGCSPQASSSVTLNTLERMSPQEIASRLSDSAFRESLKSLNT